MCGLFFSILSAIQEVSVFNLTMASSKIGLYILVSIFAFHLLPSPVICDESDTDEDLLHDINTYRKVLNLPVLEERDNPSCLADEIAGDLADKHCEDFRDYYPVPGSNPKIPNFQKSVEKCKINVNATKDAVIMPVCVPDLDSDALFSNYTKNSHFTKYLNNSKYTIAGVASEEDWMVLIISTGTASGDFSSATSLLGAGAYWKGLMMAAFFSAVLFPIS